MITVIFYTPCKNTVIRKISILFKKIKTIINYSIFSKKQKLKLNKSFFWSQKTLTNITKFQRHKNSLLPFISRKQFKKKQLHNLFFPTK
jgi:hypothetical protein